MFYLDWELVIEYVEQSRCGQAREWHVVFDDTHHEATVGCWTWWTGPHRHARKILVCEKGLEYSFRELSQQSLSLSQEEN